MAKKVNFNLLSSPDKKNGLILLRFHYKSQRFQVSTGLSIPSKHWNAKTQRVKETQAFPYAKQINARLNSLSADTLALFYDYTAEGVIPSLERFKKDWQAKVLNIETKAPAFVPFVQEMIAERKKMNRLTPVWASCLKQLEAYQTEKGKALDFENLTQAFLNDYTAFLFAQGLADSYTHRVISALKMFVRLADSRGIYENCPLLKAKAEVKKREADKVYLNEAELRLLANMELEDRLANVRDLFLVGCLSGLRFSDYSQIKPENFQLVEHAGKKVECLTMVTKKTAQKVVLPIVNPILRAILEKHGWKAPKPISVQRFNQYVKELCREAGFTQPIEISEFKSGKQEKRTVQKWELISSHTARRSFATNAIKAGLPAADIMKFTGHSTMAAFMKYVKATGEETAVHFSEHQFFTGKPSLKVVS